VLYVELCPSVLFWSASFLLCACFFLLQFCLDTLALVCAGRVLWCRHDDVYKSEIGVRKGGPENTIPISKLRIPGLPRSS